MSLWSLVRFAFKVATVVLGLFVLAWFTRAVG